MNSPQHSADSPLGAPETPSQKSEWRIKKYIKGIGASAVTGMALLLGSTSGTVDEGKKAHAAQDNVPAHIQKKDMHSHTNHAKKLPEEVMKRLKLNKEATEEMHKVGVQKYLDELQQKDPLLVSEDAVLEVCMCCIDERQQNGKAHGVAGVGILLNDEQMKVIVRNAVQKAERFYKKTGQPMTLRIQPHLSSNGTKGTCGAATLARKNRGEKDMSPKAIDEEAMTGGRRTGMYMEAYAKQREIPVKVVVEPFPEEKFLDDPNHPAAGVLVNLDNNKVANLDRKNGPMFFNVSGNIAGEKVAEDDAILAGIIALLSKHGMREDAQGLDKEIPFRIILAGAKNDIGRLKQKTEADLQNHKDLASFFRQGHIVVDTWVTTDSKKE